MNKHQYRLIEQQRGEGLPVFYIERRRWFWWEYVDHSSTCDRATAERQFQNVQAEKALITRRIVKTA